MYASHEYYVSEYLLGRENAIPGDIFQYWEKQAEKILNQYTFSRLVAKCELITDAVKDCTCELAELLYEADRVSRQASEQGGFLQSYSNDGESGTFDLSQSVYTEDGKKKKIREIIYRNLGHTGLLYAGV